MSELDKIFEAIIGLFMVLVIGYVFYLVLSALSGFLAVVFIIAVALIVVSIVLGILRRL